MKTEAEVDRLRYIGRVQNPSPLTGGSIMVSRLFSRITMSGIFLASVLIGAGLMAQTAPTPSMPSTKVPGQTTSKGGGNHSAIESNPSCQRILSECKKLGFIQGQYKKDNGLWKDCFDPVVKGGGSPTRDGKPITVPVSSSDVQACRAVAEHHNK
jgi:hypothetical protein